MVVGCQRARLAPMRRREGTGAFARRLAAGALAAAVFCAGRAGSQPAPALPPTLHASLVTRILAYDHRIPLLPAGAVVVAALIDPSKKNEPAAALEELARGASIAGRPLRVERLAWRSPDALRADLLRLQPVALLVPRELDGAVEQISQVTRALSVLSIGSTDVAVRAGLGLAVVRRGSRPAIVVNLRAARAEGASLDAALLGLSELIGEGAP